MPSHAVACPRDRNCKVVLMGSFKKGLQLALSFSESDGIGHNSVIRVEFIRLASSRDSGLSFANLSAHGTFPFAGGAAYARQAANNQCRINIGLLKFIDLQFAKLAR